MDSRLLFGDVVGLATPMLAVFAVDIATGKDAEALPVLLTTSDAVTDAAARAIASGEFKAKLGETLLLHAPAGLKAERLLVVGLGKAKTLTVNDVRKGAGTAVRAAKPRGVREMAIAFPEDRALSDEPLETLPCGLTARVLIEGAEVAELDWDTYRSERKDTSVQGLTVLAKDGERSTNAEIQEGFNEGSGGGWGAEFCAASGERAGQCADADGAGGSGEGDVRRGGNALRRVRDGHAERAWDGGVCGGGARVGGGTGADCDAV